jgi:hypothetical protein
MREHLWPAHGCQDADHGADGVTHEDRVLEPQFVADLQHVLGIAGERAVLAAVVSRVVGAAGADVIEEHDAVTVLEGGEHPAPHLLVAAEAMREHEWRAALSADRDVVPAQCRHRFSVERMDENRPAPSCEGCPTTASMSSTNDRA